MGLEALHQISLYREEVVGKMRAEPGPSRTAAGLPERDFGVDAAHNPRCGIAEALATVFTPAAGSVRDLAVRQFLFTPFRGPPGFAASAGVPFSHEIRLPRPPALVSQTYPREVKIFVQQNPAMFPRALFQAGIENDNSAADECGGVRGVACRVSKIGPVPDFDLPAVKKLKEGSGHPPTINCMDLAALLTEQANPASAHIDKLSTEEMLRVIGMEDRKVAEAVAIEIPRIALAVEGIVAAFRNGGRLFYIGAGTSGRLGVLDASECPPTFNVLPDLVQGIIAGGEAALSRATETTEDDPAMGARDLEAHGFLPKDVLCGIAASGRTPYVLGATDEANRLNALTIGISCTPDSDLARRAKIAITPLTGPEVIAGSTRLKAGTATKMVLNMLTTGSFIRLGYVRGNLMVNVQPKNSKLLDRSKRIISETTGVSYEEAGRMLTEAGNSVRAAIEGWEQTRKHG
jgi:N-acetylmuramic acid 6-phosphate etherase